MTFPKNPHRYPANGIKACKDKEKEVAASIKSTWGFSTPQQ
jgi:hypothetical protein